MEKIAINIKRLIHNLDSLGKIGCNRNGGIDRALGSRADYKARQWILDYWSNILGLEVHIDSIGNLWGMRNSGSSLPPIVIGSHHDAVPNGGHYDGALGVLAATEIMQTYQEQEILTEHPLYLVSFTGEEPNPYNVSTLGSKVLSGRLTTEDLQKLTHHDTGAPFSECLEEIGGCLAETKTAKLTNKDIGAFIELHIEQGKRLYEHRNSTAIVTCITGIYRENITIHGTANHGGTTNMPDRHDALLTACELNLAFESLLLEENDKETVGTIGFMEVFPNAVSIIPDKVQLTLEIRTCQPEKRKRILEKLTAVCEEISERRGTTIERTLNLDQKEMPMSPLIQSALKEAMIHQNVPVHEYVSMAGHDAANIARFTESGMIFTQSVNGKSHCADEYSKPETIEETVNVLAEAIPILDKEMSAHAAVI